MTNLQKDFIVCLFRKYYKIPCIPFDDGNNWTINIEEIPDKEGNYKNFTCISEIIRDANIYFNSIPHVQAVQRVNAHSIKYTLK